MSSGRDFFDNVTPYVGRGRGRGLLVYAGEEVKKLAFTDIPQHSVGSTSLSQTLPPHFSDSEEHAQVKTGHVVTSPVGPISSTPIVSVSGNDPAADLRDLITELGNQIGDSIVSRLFAPSPPVLPSFVPVSPVVGGDNPGSSTLDLSRVNVVVKHDVREPAVFRGEASDKCTVQEWIELMEVYLRKRNCLASDQPEEILSHLMGKAKKIVKVGLKSNLTPDSAVHPEMIYEILRRYFSESPASCLPLADFYATQPSMGEDPVDYWVRLNTAAEQADRHLKMQGRELVITSAEISMMFIRNCNDPELASVFKGKSVGRWTAMEVQEAIDEYQREHVSKRKSGKGRPIQVAAAAAFSMADVKEEVSQSVPSPHSPIGPSESPGAEGGAFEHVLCMLERVLEGTNQASPPAATQPGPWVRFTACRVCGDKAHSTRSHCMREKRCLACFAVGHQRRECTVSGSTKPNITVPFQGN